MPYTNPTSCSAADGAIYLDLSGSQPGIYYFEIRRFDPVTQTWSAWSAQETADIPGGLFKSYNGLLYGTYQINVRHATDPRCFITKSVELTCDLDQDGNVVPCGFKLDITPNGSNFERIEYSQIDEYKIGRSPFTISAWYHNNEDAVSSDFILYSMSNFPFGSSVSGSGPYVEFSARIRRLCNQNWFEVVFNYDGTDNDFGNLANASKFTFGPFDLLENEMNQISLVVHDTYINGAFNLPTVPSDVPALPPSTTLGSTNALAIGNYCYNFYVNGVRIDTQPTQIPLCNPPINTVITDFTGDTLAVSSLSAAERNYVKNFNNYNRFFAGNRPSAPITSSGFITNLQVYRRALSGEEIQSNYFNGCHGEPSNCNGLIIYSPLDQSSGAISPELRHQNAAQLKGYVLTRTLLNGGAWVTECCQPTNVNTFECPAQECEPGFAIAQFEINYCNDDSLTYTTLPGLDLFVSDFSVGSVTNIGSSSDSRCGTYSQYQTRIDTDVPNTYKVSIPAYSGPALSCEEANAYYADLFATEFNSLPAAERNDALAYANLNQVTIKWAIDPENPLNTCVENLCGINFRICAFDPSTEELIDDLNICYPKGNFITCCVEDVVGGGSNGAACDPNSIVIN